jgi:fluoride ion exporter CrcB/FEX
VRSGNAGNHNNNGTNNNSTTQEFDQHFQHQQEEDKRFVEKFWTGFDDVIMLSLFTQLGIVARLGVSTWFTFFEGVFSNDSPLFVNLPLNCLSCFLMGMLSSGESLMEIVATRFSPPRLQQALQRRPLSARRKKTDGDLANGGGGVASMDIDVDDGNSSQDLAPGGFDEEDGHSSDDGAVLRDGSGHARWNNNPLRRRRRRRPKRARPEQTEHLWWEPPVRLDEELRDVQLLALERRIRRSKCLLLFPVRKEDVDVMEHYFDEGYRKDDDDGDEEDYGVGGDDSSDDLEDPYNVPPASSHDVDGEDEYQRVLSARLALENDLALEESVDPEVELRFRKAHPHAKAAGSVAPGVKPPPSVAAAAAALTSEPSSRASNSVPGSRLPTAPTFTVNQGGPSNPVSQGGSARPDTVAMQESVELHGEQPSTDLNQMVTEVSANVTENISRLQRVKLRDGWDVGTTPEAMSDDLMLGLRFGFCGALSSFSSWNSAMINLIRDGHIGEAFVGYMLGLQLPIVAYRFGQHVAVFAFIWRCRQETKRDERRGYGIRVAMNEDSDRGNPLTDEDVMDGPVNSMESGYNQEPSERETPSIRAVATALFIMALVTQCTSISFYSDYDSQLVALSLLFSPLGVIARWRLSSFNNWRPTFPLGTFVCNIFACVLSGGLGTLLAGDPGERERLVLVSFINGFGGTLSSVAAFIVEVLAGIDPVLLRFDGAVYALFSVFWAFVVGVLFTASADWADTTG